MSSRHPWYTDSHWLQQQQQRQEQSAMEKAVLRKRPPNLRKERRSAMLASMLKNAVQEIFISGSIGRCVQNVAITKVKMDPSLVKAQIFWLLSGDSALDDQVRTTLLDCASEIRQQLHQRLIMSTVPPLEFLADRAVGGQAAVDTLLERARRSDRFQTVEESAARLSELYAPSSAASEERRLRRVDRAEQQRLAGYRDNGLAANLSVYGLDREALVRKVAGPCRQQPLRYEASAGCDLTEDPNYPLRGLVEPVSED